MTTAGLEIDPSLTAFGDFHVEGGHAWAMKVLRRPDRPTAVFAGSDLQAIGVLEAAGTLGLRTPEDLSVVGIVSFAIPVLLLIIAALCAYAFMRTTGKR